MIADWILELAGELADELNQEVIVESENDDPVFVQPTEKESQ